MRIATFLTVISLALACAAAPAFAECEDKSQQNAADEAGIHGTHEAASKCATPGEVARASKKMEDAAARAKRSSEGGPPVSTEGSGAPGTPRR